MVPRGRLVSLSAAEYGHGRVIGAQPRSIPARASVLRWQAWRGGSPCERISERCAIHSYSRPAASTRGKLASMTGRPRARLAWRVDPSLVAGIALTLRDIRPRLSQPASVHLGTYRRRESECQTLVMHEGKRKLHSSGTTGLRLATVPPIN